MGLSERLRTARIERGLTLESASARSSVALRYVRMFEDGKYPLVADPVYLAGFVRRYAGCVGLNEEQASREFVAEIVNAAARTTAGKCTPPVGSRPGRLRPRLFNFYAGPLSVIAVVWTIGPLSPFQWTERTPPAVAVMELGHDSAPPAALPPTTTGPVSLPPVEAPPPSVPEVPATVVIATNDPELDAVLAEEKSPVIASDRSATDKASDQLRADQLARVKQRMSERNALGSVDGGA